VTLADQWQPAELYHQRWAADLRAVPQNDLMHASLTWPRTAAGAQIRGVIHRPRTGGVSDDSLLRPDSHYGVYKTANEGNARIYSMTEGIGSIGLRPFVVCGSGRDQGTDLRSHDGDARGGQGPIPN
jgi:hypothetical protein